MDESLDLESSPRMVAVARQFVHDKFRSWGLDDRLDDALLVVSELVSNAVLHARTAIELRVRYAGDRLRIEVFDQNSRLPVIAPCPSDATSGRGLSLVAAVSSGWGIEYRGDGKVVWAEVELLDDRPDAKDRADLDATDTLDEALRQMGGRDRDSAGR